MAGRATQAACRATVTELKALQELVAQVWSHLWVADGGAAGGGGAPPSGSRRRNLPSGSRRDCTQLELERAHPNLTTPKTLTLT